MRNIKKLLTLTYLFLVLFSYPAAAAVRADSEKFQFQLSASAAEELLPGDTSEQWILVKNNTGQPLRYRVESVRYTGSEVLAQYLELSILDGDEPILFGTVKELSDRKSFDRMLHHPAGQDRSLRLRLRLQKEAPNAAAGETLAASILFFGTDAPIEARDPTNETEEVKETKKDPEASEISKESQASESSGTKDTENANHGRPSGESQTAGHGKVSTVAGKGYSGKQQSLSAEDPPITGFEKLFDLAFRFFDDHSELWTETAAQPFTDEQAETTSSDDMEHGSDESEHETTVRSDRRRSGFTSSAEKTTVQSKDQDEAEDSSIQEDGITAKLSISIWDITKKTAAVYIHSDGGGGSSEDPVTVYIGPSKREKRIFAFAVLLILLLLILLILKCWLLYRSAQEKNEEDGAHDSEEPRA